MMSILDAARRHFGPRWKPDIQVIGPEEFRKKLAELQKEIGQLQQSYERLRAVDLRSGNRGDARDDIHVISSGVEKELATLHGWTVSLVETMFSLVAMEMGNAEEKALRREWQIHV